MEFLKKPFVKGITQTPAQCRKIQSYLQQLEADSPASSLGARCLYCVNIPKSQAQHTSHNQSEKP